MVTLAREQADFTEDCHRLVAETLRDFCETKVEKDEAVDVARADGGDSLGASKTGVQESHDSSGTTFTDFIDPGNTGRPGGGKETADSGDETSLRDKHWSVFN